MCLTLNIQYKQSRQEVLTKIEKMKKKTPYSKAIQNGFRIRARRMT